MWTKRYPVRFQLMFCVLGTVLFMSMEGRAQLRMYMPSVRFQVGETMNLAAIAECLPPYPPGGCALAGNWLLQQVGGTAQFTVAPACATTPPGCGFAGSGPPTIQPMPFQMTCNAPGTDALFLLTLNGVFQSVGVMSCGGGGGGMIPPPTGPKGGKGRRIGPPNQPGIQLAEVDDEDDPCGRDSGLPPVDIGGVVVSTCRDVNTINVTQGGLTVQFPVAGRPLGIVGGLVVGAELGVVTDAPSLFIYGDSPTEIPLMGSSVHFAAVTRQTLDPTVPDLLYAVTDQEVIVRSAGSNRFFTLPGTPSRGGLVQRVTDLFTVEELVIETNAPATATTSDRWVYSLLDGTSPSRWKFNGDSAAPTILFRGLGGEGSCAGTTVFEDDAVTVIQDFVDTRTALRGQFRDWLMVPGGIRISTSAGEQDIAFSPLCEGHMHAAAPLKSVESHELTLAQGMAEGAVMQNMMTSAAFTP